MKNKYISGTHISVRRFRQFLRYFAMDLTALQIAELSCMNRNTANLWINRIRMRILLIVEREKLTGADCVQIDEMYFTKSKEYFPKWKLPYDEIPVFGIVTSQGMAYARPVEKANKECVFPVILGCLAMGATVFTDASVLYKGLSGLGFKHKFVNHSMMEFARTEDGLRVTTNRIEGFWGWTRSRMAKFKGVRWENIEQHIAESVWRFNHRQDDIYKLLLDELRARPLN